MGNKLPISLHYLAQGGGLRSLPLFETLLAWGLHFQRLERHIVLVPNLKFSECLSEWFACLFLKAGKN